MKYLEFINNKSKQKLITKYEYKRINDLLNNEHENKALMVKGSSY